MVPTVLNVVLTQREDTIVLVMIAMLLSVETAKHVMVCETNYQYNL